MKTFKDAVLPRIQEHQEQDKKRKAEGKHQEQDNNKKKENGENEPPTTETIDDLIESLNDSDFPTQEDDDMLLTLRSLDERLESLETKMGKIESLLILLVDKLKKNKTIFVSKFPSTDRFGALSK